MLLVAPNKMAAYGVELSFSLRNVPLSPTANGVQIRLHPLDKNNDVGELIGETELVRGYNNIDFQQKTQMNMRFEKLQRFRVNVDMYSTTGPNRLGELGWTDFDLAMVFACGGKLTLPLTASTQGITLEVAAKAPDYYSQFLRLQFHGSYIHSHDGVPLQLYFIVSLPTEERIVMLYKSEMIKDTKNPEWRPFSIPLFLLNYFNESSIQLTVYNYLPNHDDQLVGQCTTTLTQLQQGVGHFNSYMLMETNGRRIHEKTCVELKMLKLETGPTFFQMVQDNCKLQLTTAIDLTASNGNPVTPNSLHYIHPHQPSAYLEAIIQATPPFLGYLPNPQSPQILGLGFGAKVQERPGGELQLSHCFCLTGSVDPRVGDLSGLISSYRQATMGLQPFAPTDFSEVIYYVSKFAKAETRRHVGLYFVLIIYSDGGPANALNMKRTVDAIVDASTHPMSIIAIGVGQDRDHTPMRSLEKLTLKHSDGRLLARQNYTYVHASQLESSDALATIPIQMVQWKRLFHYAS